MCCHCVYGRMESKGKSHLGRNGKKGNLILKSRIENELRIQKWQKMKITNKNKLANFVRVVKCPLNLLLFLVIRRSES